MTTARGNARRKTTSLSTPGQKGAAPSESPHRSELSRHGTPVSSIRTPADLSPKWAIEVARRLAFDMSSEPVNFGFREQWTAKLHEGAEEVASVKLGLHPYAVDSPDFAEQCARVSEAVGAVGFALRDEHGRAKRCLFTGLTEHATAVIVIEEILLQRALSDEQLIAEFIKNAIATVVGDQRAVVASTPVSLEETGGRGWRPSQAFWEGSGFVHFTDGVFVGPQLRFLIAELEGRSVARELDSWRRQVVWAMDASTNDQDRAANVTDADPGRCVKDSGA